MLICNSNLEIGHSYIREVAFESSNKVLGACGILGVFLRRGNPAKSYFDEHQISLLRTESFKVTKVPKDF
jgi:hypothetical protein